ncbi:MAG TPA: response regulator transcription factor [Acidobacteriaceae bacterium]|jgi:DNA-binding NarL/FixJ family response regulator|nr:response regulator transcription factor [Acidobacteriaceae bacterium]
MDTASIRVLCADDHPLILDGVARTIDSTPGIELIAEATNGSEAIEAFRKHKPDVALIDLKMPVVDGVEAIRTICGMYPRARCVVLTTYQGDFQATRAFRAGAVGYLLKTMLRKELIQTIRRVHEGQRCVPQEVASEMTKYFSSDELSPREVEVLQTIAGGRSNKCVADTLNISEDTVKGHMRNILSKLGANDRLDAVLIAMRRGILSMS